MTKIYYLRKFGATIDDGEMNQPSKSFSWCCYRSIRRDYMRPITWLSDMISYQSFLKSNFHSTDMEWQDVVFNYYSFWGIYLLFNAILSSLIIHLVDGIDYTDSLFLSVSAVTTTGLSSVSMTELGPISFVCLSVLMFLGTTTTVQMMTIAYRRYRYDKYRQRLNSLPDSQRKSLDRCMALRRADDEQQALSLTLSTLMAYTLVNYLLGFLFLYAALCGHPNEPELEARGVSTLQNAAFLFNAAFANAGFTISSASVGYLQNNFGAYFILTALTLSGNTLLPVLWRYFIFALYRIASSAHLPSFLSGRAAAFSESLVRILNRSRSFSAYLFEAPETAILAESVALITTLSFVFFLATAFVTPDSLGQKYGDALKVAGMGWFQTFSIRSTGFQMLDFQLLNQGVLVGNIVMMYVPTAPFLSYVEETEEKHDPVAEQRFYTRHPSLDSLELAALEEKASASAHGSDADSSREEEGGEGGGDGDEVAEGVPQQQEQQSQRIRRRRRSGPRSTTSEHLAKHERIATLLSAGFFRDYCMSHTTILLVAVLLTITIESSSSSMRNPSAGLNSFFIIFESFSAYGNSGVSVGLPGASYSLCGAYSTASKVICMAIMILGKFRGLPRLYDTVIDFKFSALKWDVYNFLKEDQSSRAEGDRPAAGAAALRRAAASESESDQCGSLHEGSSWDDGTSVHAPSPMAKQYQHDSDDNLTGRGDIPFSLWEF